MRRVLFATLLAVALSGSLAACGGDAPARRAASPLAAVQAAAARSSSAGSSQFSLENTTVVTGQPIRITGEGAFDYAGKQGTLKLVLPTGSVEQRVVGGKVYLALSQQPGTFYALTLDQVQGTSLGGSTDPSASFASLDAASDDVREVGHEKVRDADTTHYRGTVDVKKAVATANGAARQIAEATLGRAGVSRVPFDAWVDDSGRLRKYVQELQVPAGPGTGGAPVKSSTTIELFDYGVDVQVKAPAPQDVKDGAPLLAALKGQGGR